MNNKAKTIIGVSAFLIGVILMGVALAFDIPKTVYNACLLSGMLLTAISTVILYLVAQPHNGEKKEGKE